MKGYSLACVIDIIKEDLQNVGPHDKSYFDTKTHIFNSLLFSGSVCKAVHHITKKNISGVLQPDDTDEKQNALL